MRFCATCISFSLRAASCLSARLWTLLVLLPSGRWHSPAPSSAFFGSILQTAVPVLPSASSACQNPHLYNQSWINHLYLRSAFSFTMGITPFLWGRNHYTLLSITHQVLTAQGTFGFSNCWRVSLDPLAAQQVNGVSLWATWAQPCAETRQTNKRKKVQTRYLRVQREGLPCYQANCFFSSEEDIDIVINWAVITKALISPFFSHRFLACVEMMRHNDMLSSWKPGFRWKPQAISLFGF